VTVTADPTSDNRARFEEEAIPYMRQMFPAAVRLTKDRCDAEDLLQETFARAFQKFHQFTPGTNLRAWLYCIMSRTFYSSCRSRSRRPAEVLETDLLQGAGSPDGFVPPARSAEAEALEGLGDSPVMRALTELPVQFKTVVYLADVQGYQYAEIASMMGTPIGTVMSRIHRGRQLLRSRLASVLVGGPAAPAGTDSASTDAASTVRRPPVMTLAAVAELSQASAPEPVADLPAGADPEVVPLAA
jgi:RNA polymerase sigma-70 factor (ECF subfamily)